MLDNIAYYIMRCWGALTFDLLRGFHPSVAVDVNKTEARTMYTIFTQEGNPMSFYSKLLGLENGSFSTIADSLENKGLIKREFSYDDKRLKNLVLTDYGREIAGSVKAQLNDFLNKRIELLTEEEKAQLINALTTLEKLRSKVY